MPFSGLRARGSRALVRAAVRRARLERPYDRAIAEVRRRRADLRDRRFHDRVGAILRAGVVASGDGAWATGGSDPVPLVMCLWNRPERIEHVLEMLARLDPARPVRLLLWNNNGADAAVYAAAVDEWRSARLGAREGGLVSVDLVQSPENIGGLARFVAARLLRNAGYRGPVFMLDDDQDVAPSFVTDLLADWSPRSVIAWWGFSLHGSYWRRAEIEPGTEPDHAGTGGTVFDVDLVADDRFFDRLPSDYRFLEDQWMTFFARSSGWRIRKGRTHIDLVLEEKNQYHGLRPLKDDFYAWQQSPAGPRALVGAAKPHGWDAGRIRFVR